MRLNNEGSYFPPNDTLNDAIKAIEEIIKDTGESGKLSIGIDCNANNYYSETTKKYEMDGFKQPPEAEALIDFYIKFCNEHPLINYLEDPISDLDLSGWRKLYAKFESKPNVTIYSRRLVNNHLTTLPSLIESHNLEEVHDSMSDEEKKRIQETNKIIEEKNHSKVSLSNISLCLAECTTVSDMMDCFKYFRGKRSGGITIWDSPFDSDQSMAVELGFAVRAKFVLLHAFNNRTDRLAKINKYIDLIEENY